MVKCCMPCGGFKKLSINDDIVPDSSFIFACRFNVFGMLVAAFTYALEFGILVYFYQISQESHPKSVYVGLVPSCDGTDGQDMDGSAAVCTENMDVSMTAVACALLILILTIAPDFVGGLHLAVRRRNVWQIIVGCAMMSLSIMSLVSASAFVIATAQDDVAVYSNCIAILFVLACDEQMFYVIKMLFPAFVEETIQAVTEGEDSTAIGIMNDVRFAELMGRKKITVETEMTTEPQQVESPHAGAPRV